ALYHGQLDQRERETALALFNNGSAPVLVATDLAARGLDIRNVENIIHYHQPLTPETNTHRNGRTARVDASGDIFMLIGPEEDVKPFVEIDQTYRISDPGDISLRSGFSTIWFGDGRREKLSKGDILGFLTKTCGLTASEVGKIEVFDHYSLVAVASDKARSVVQTASSTPVKGRKRRVSILTL
ncbi:MAG: DbpA RNA binding domain-containing protein, partial [Muribaculaceae bacterium]|nr:DbpA RNA binding domain-containing protein [Muribaculaceae bacterium]